uniref:Murine leukemia virus integrase C-terminal domain-containing protein n=1 Tax=Melopsittacus undulatus TaxID=13146 RepID=A0A8V5GRT1_MELUD
MVALSKQLREIGKHVAGTRSPGLDGPVHDIQPGDYVYVKSGDWVYVKNFPGDPLQEKWSGPYQILLTTFTAVKIKEQPAWIHYSRIKKAPEPEKTWQIEPSGPLRMKSRRS